MKLCAVLDLAKEDHLQGHFCSISVEGEYSLYHLYESFLWSSCTVHQTAEHVPIIGVIDSLV